MRRWLPGVSWIVCCAMLGSCSGENSDGGNGGLTIMEFGRRLSAAYCERMFRCCTDSEIAERTLFSENPVQDPESCSEAVESWSALDLLGLMESMNAGRVAFDEERAAECLEEIDAEGCELGLAVVPFDMGCDDAFVPLVEDGGSCEFDEDCKGGLCVDSVCARLPDVGEPCLYDCVPGAFCASDDGTCRELLPDGAPCWNSDECRNHCNTDYGSEEAPGTCEPPVECIGR